ncbi:anhydro-N-acetylmuramic acid kinase [Thioalkalivibrio sp. XN8]|uniref:anhydro-N-acetylmuramic acid kinase n=1 Tax=Thioalkalivibrio sp. XN8 TaxID=2712863 RepID=UPI0023EFB9CB|nr:anhydro-N-acetylmuramic acid kinase [Thioalkalivibrio sp. XN8]
MAAASLLPGYYLGLMSGTSMDAVDAVLAVAEAGTFRVHAARAEPLPGPVAERLRRLALPGPADPAGPDPVDELGALDRLVGELFAAAAKGLLAEAGVAASEVRAIGSHGQTLRHRPRSPHPFTLQVGDPNLVAEHTGITVVADFRRRDVALGGQGAPLVPAFHAAVFADPREYRAVLNLGGIANLTLLPPGEAVTGFDTGPANTLLDAWARRHLGTPCDEDGRWAAAGRVDEALLHRLLAHPFLALPPPKSTGPEEFSPAWLDAELAALGHAPAPADVQATLGEFTARTVAEMLAPRPPARLVACGGGARNPHLMGRLGALLPGTRVESSAAYSIDPGHVEAAAFAWLAARTLAGLPGNLPSVTGARRAAVLGAVWPA